jgi:alkylation response protein AidB-like acyl-CoA dehydrogenase
MDLELTEAQRSARDVARRFAREKLERGGVEVDRTHRFPLEAIRELSRLGMLGVFILSELATNLSGGATCLKWLAANGSVVLR